MLNQLQRLIDKIEHELQTYQEKCKNEWHSAWGFLYMLSFRKYNDDGMSNEDSECITTINAILTTTHQDEP